MAYITSIGTAVPEHKLPQETVKQFVYEKFRSSYAGLDKLIAVFDHSGINERYFAAPLEWYLQPHSAKERNEMYIEQACSLTQRAIEQCLAGTGIGVEEIHHLVFVSTTGHATPSIDAHLFNRMGMNPHLKRTPIWGLGCAGGASGLSRAFEYVTAFPEHRCLVVSVELCSLTFLATDYSKSNLVATCLFADGAAAALISGERCKEASRGQHRIVSTQSTIWKDSLDVMGWNIVDDGMQVVFSRDIPTLVKQEMKPNVEQFLHPLELGTTDISNYVLHPGGMKVLSAYEESLGIEPHRLDGSRKVLAGHGNMSSATVLFVMKEAMASDTLDEGYGLIGALGPGFSSELLLLETKKMRGGS